MLLPLPKSREPCLFSPGRITQDFAQGLPFFICEYGDDAPFVVPQAFVATVRGSQSIIGMVTLRYDGTMIDCVVHNSWTQQGAHRLIFRDIYILTFAGSVSVFEGD